MSFNHVFQSFKLFRIFGDTIRLKKVGLTDRVFNRKGLNKSVIVTPIIIRSHFSYALIVFLALFLGSFFSRPIDFFFPFLPLMPMKFSERCDDLSLVSYINSFASSRSLRRHKLEAFLARASISILATLYVIIFYAYALVT